MAGHGAFANPVLVIDAGTSSTKLGFAGRAQPSTVMATEVCGARAGEGQDAHAARAPDVRAGPGGSTPPPARPVRGGVVRDFTVMEEFWAQCFQGMGLPDASEHAVLVTEPPHNPPAAREATAQAFFETFNAPALYTGLQPVLAQYSAFAAAEAKQQPAGSLTGCVVDVGEDATTVTPVVEGHLVASAIRTLPLGGRHCTQLVERLLRERGEAVPQGMWPEVARAVKERHGYVCGDVAKEFKRHDCHPQDPRYMAQHAGTDARSGKAFAIDVGYERFMAPELFWWPEVQGGFHDEPPEALPLLVDSVVQRCPIDARRALYANIILSGGSTMFRGFGQRLQREVAWAANKRLAASAKPIEVRVVSHRHQRYAAWVGGSVVASAPEFPQACVTRAQYEEHGPSICRDNCVFQSKAPGRVGGC